MKSIKLNWFIKCCVLLIPIFFSFNKVTIAFVATDVVWKRYNEFLLRTSIPNAENIDLWVKLITPEQQWADINYKDTELALWDTPKHLERIKLLAIAWSKPGSSHYHDEAVWRTISLALDHWLEKRYENSNWWHTQIGVPQYMRDIIILIRNRLSSEQFKQAMEVLGQHKVQGTGANLIWSADLGIHYAALINNEDLLKRYLGMILRETRVSTKEGGIQPDYSFHQHGPRLQMYQYGRAFFTDNVRLAWQLRSTPWAFPKEKVIILSDFALQGWQWMARGIHTVPGTMDRSSSREGELRSPDIRKLLPFLIELIPENATEFKAVSDRQDGRGTPLTGYRYYPYSDFTVHHRKDFSFFLKTVSIRTLLTESINNENLKGRLLNGGDAYLVKDGNEYFNLMPVWNWEMLPGITNYKGAGKISRQNFTGSVSNGLSGLTVMDYLLEDKDKNESLSAHKFWASHENVVVCLIADLKTENIEGEVFTALDQSRWRGDVTVNKMNNVLGEGVHHIEKLKWLHHSGFGYIPINASAIDLHLKTVSGRWTSINASESDAPVTEKVFMPVMLHSSKKPGGQSAGYVLSSSQTSRQTAKLANKPTWKVLQNDKACQAVYFKDKTITAAFFTAGSLRVEGSELIVNAPCLILISKDKIYASDPVHKGGTIKVKWNNKEMEIVVPKDGTSSEGIPPGIGDSIYKNNLKII